MFSGRLPPRGELPRSGQDAAGQRGEVVAGVQDVGLAALAFLQPHEVRAGREERAGTFPVELQDDAADAEHHPHRDHDVVWWSKRQDHCWDDQTLDLCETHRCVKLTNGLEGHIGERRTEVVVEEAFEDVERDVREAGVNVGVDGEDYSVSADDAARDNVSLMAKTHVLINSTASSFVPPLDGVKVQSCTCCELAGVFGVTSLGQRTKRRGTVIMMEQNVTQKTTSEFLNTLRSPDGRTQGTWTNCLVDSCQRTGWVFFVFLFFLNFHTKRSEEDSGGDEEAEDQSNHDDARHDGTEPPPAHDQDDPAHNSDHG